MFIDKTYLGRRGREDVVLVHDHGQHQRGDVQGEAARKGVDLDLLCSGGGVLGVNAWMMMLR